MDVAESQLDDRVLVVVVHTEKDRTAGGQHLPRRELRLGEGLAKAGRHAHHLTRRLHLRT